jgi:uncharacterized protein (DUF1810 family)
MADDPYNLDRFVFAQDLVYTQVRDEIGRGRKASHWMWFVFPQIAGLGFSERSQRYAISGLDEARAYLAHPTLGQRLRECVRLVLAAEGRSAHKIFGSPDDSKLHSSLTLFAEVSDDAIFSLALQKYFGGEFDRATMERLR